MPKKGKGKGKKKGSAKKKKSASAKKAAASAGPEIVDEATREFYLLQLKDLDERVTRYREKTDVLELRNKDLEVRLHQEQRDKFDITITLKRQLGETNDLNAELHEKLSELHGKRQTDKDEFDKQLQVMKTQLKEQRDQLNSEIKKLRVELKDLEEFRMLRDDLEAKTRRLEVQLETTEEEFRQYKMDIEKKMVLDQERLKNDMMAKLEATSIEFRKVSDQRMSETTKRAISENGEVHGQLKIMADEVNLLTEKNKKLRDRVAGKTTQLEIVQANYDTVLEQKVSNERVIKMLVLKIQDQSEKLTECEHLCELVDRLEDRLDKTNDERVRFEKMASKSAAQVMWLEENLRKTRQDLDNLQPQHETVTEVLGDLSALLQERLGGGPVSDDYNTARSSDDIMVRMFDVMRIAADKGLVQAKRSSVAAGYSDTAFTKPPSARDAAPSSTLLSTQHRGGKRLPPIQHHTGVVSVIPGNSVLTTALDSPRRQEDHSKLSVDTSQQTSVQSVGVQTASIPRALLLVDRLLAGGEAATGPEEQQQRRRSSVANTASRTALTESDFYLQSQLSRQEQVLVESIQQFTNASIKG